MGGGKVVPAERARSHVSYYVVMAAILGLLALLCCYVCYFFISKIRELSGSELPPTTTTTTPATPCIKKTEQAAYPVQPMVRDTATAMAALCRQLPAGYVPQGDQVFPGARSPAPRPAHASPSPPAPHPADAPEVEAPGKVPEEEPRIAVEVPSIAVEAAR